MESRNRHGLLITTPPQYLFYHSPLKGMERFGVLIPLLPGNGRQLRSHLSAKTIQGSRLQESQALEDKGQVRWGWGEGLQKGK